MVLNEQTIKEIIKAIQSPELREQRTNDKRRFQIYNGNLEPSIREALVKEFSLKESVDALIHRMVPLNIVQKIINKLAGIYLEAPSREPVIENDADEELIYLYEENARLNIKMKEANRYFKLFKRNLMEVFVDKGIPKFRNLPRHTYEAFSFSGTSPEMPDLIVKIMNDAPDPSQQQFVFWTNEQFLVVNGLGEIDRNRLAMMDNPDGVNPYGALPFVYINASSYSVIPEPDDDLLRMGVLIPILLSDMAFACKYQTWSIIYTIGVESDIKFNPNSVVSLPMTADGQKPEIGTIKPQFDSDKMLTYIESLIDMLLTTKNLSATAISGKLSAASPASGISKALDGAESVEDKKDQQEFFYQAERDLFNLLKNYMIPYWRKNQMLDEKMNREFSSDFEISVTLRDPKVTLTEREQIELAKLKLPEQTQLSTLKRELSALNPDMTEDKIEELEREIMEESARRNAVQVEMMKPEPQMEPDMDDEDEDETDE